VQGDFEPRGDEATLCRALAGASWYEAAAYAAFAGKQLPTMAHWATVAGSAFFTSILPAANFGGTGPLAGKDGGVLHRFGTMNLAGNVKEWVANSAGADLRYTLGGAWDEPSYMAIEPDARPALERAPNFGFRCARFDTELVSEGLGATPFCRHCGARDPLLKVSRPCGKCGLPIFQKLHRPVERGRYVFHETCVPPKKGFIADLFSKG
jgi:hypothetical protein